MNEIEKIDGSLKLSELTQAQKEKLISELASIQPDTNTLTVEQYINGFKKSFENELQNKIERQVKIKRIDYKTEKDNFLNRYKSACTRNTYEHALNHLETFCKNSHIESVLHMTFEDADRFIRDYKNNAFHYISKELQIKEPKFEFSASSIRQTIAAASSFFSYMARHHEEIKNIFLGTDERPDKQDKRPLSYPNKKEVELIYSQIKNQKLKAIVYLMAHCGFRCGAFQSMKIIKQDTNRFIFKTETKGSEFTGTLSKDCIATLHACGIKTTAKQIEPFTEFDADKIKNYVKYYTNKLYDKDALIHLIAAPYSAHDFRHYFAYTEYQKTKDIYKVRDLLNHKSIAITEIYLKKINAIV